MDFLEAKYINILTKIHTNNKRQQIINNIIAAAEKGLYSISSSNLSTDEIQYLHEKGYSIELWGINNCTISWK